MRIFRHSRLDLFIVLVCCSYPALMVTGALLFDAMSTAQVVGWAVLLGLVWQSGSYAYHHHNHLNIFQHKPLNRAFEIVCSAGWRIPVSREAYYHFIHHSEGFLELEAEAYNTRPWIKAAAAHCGFFSPKKTFYNLCDVFGLRWITGVLHKMYSLRGQPKPEARRTFSWRRKKDNSEPWEFTEFAIARGQVGHVVLECVAIVALHATVAFINPVFYLAVCAPVQFISYVIYDYQDFCEHTAVDLRYPGTLSASCYNTLYNLWLFNGGFHQEHHWREGLHWSRMPDVRGQLLDADQRRVIPLSMYLSPFLSKPPLISERSTVRPEDGWSITIEEDGTELALIARQSGTEAEAYRRAVAPELRDALVELTEGEPSSVGEVASRAGLTEAQRGELSRALDELRQRGALGLEFDTQRTYRWKFESTPPAWSNYLEYT